MFSKVLFLAFGSCVAVLGDTTVVPNSCTDLEDGVYTMKLIDDDTYPLVSIKCSNGYGILDYSYDNNIVEYFDTYYQWFPKTIGPTNEAHVNWQEWFLPHMDSSNNDNQQKEEEREKVENEEKEEKEEKEEETLNFETKYAVSPDCSSCDVSHKRQLYESKTTYWMTGTIFGCFWAIKGNHNCDIDYDTNTCYTCDTARGETFSAITDDSTADDFLTTGICPHNVQSSDYYTPVLHDDCSESEEKKNLYHLKPSLGTEGEYCVCFQQSKTDYIQVTDIDVLTHEIEFKQKQKEKKEEDEKLKIKKQENNEDTMVYYIYQNDFTDGTYRIKESGTYIVMEDITFDFNNNEESPNSERSYLPLSEQNDDYPGAGQYKGSYFLGFFAGITIECDNVVLDLNGNTLKMSDYFYHQQRWFTTIEIGTQYFLPGQGTGNFGGSPITPSNIEIKNGELGLTSHHGIHGNSNTNVILKNLRVYDFETHGIQFNGFDQIYMEQIEVGPTSNKVFFNGEYGHLRQLLMRYRDIADEMDEAYNVGKITDEVYYVKFDGRDEQVSMRDIVTKLEMYMNIAFDHLVKAKSYDQMSEENKEITYDDFNEAVRLFLNQNTGFAPNAGAQYGIFLNTFGASVFTYNLDTNYYSTDATLIDIKIHGMRHSMKEYVQWREYGAKNLMVNPFGGPLNAFELLENIYDLSSPKYKGNIITDAVIASNMFSNSFDMLALQVVKNDYLVPWAIGTEVKKVTNNEIESIQIGCNSDVMIHSGKGINGLRLDGVSDIYIKNIEIFDNVDETPLGQEVCGEYDAMNGNGNSALYGGHFRQTMPMQTGFSGNMNQAININAAKNIVFENVHIHDIMSWTGPAFGMSIWPSCDVTLKGDIIIHDIQAGVEVPQDKFTYESRPNKSPEVCGVRTYYQYSDYTTSLNDDDATYTIDEDSFNGHVGCFGTDTLDRNPTLDTYDSFQEDDDSIESIEIEENEEMVQHGKNNHIISNNQDNYILTITFISFMVFGLGTMAIVLKKMDNEGYIAIQDAK